MRRYPRGKSWNWYQRCEKRGDVSGPIWLTLRMAKKDLAGYLERGIYGLGDNAQFEGLQDFLNDETEVLEVAE